MGIVEVEDIQRADDEYMGWCTICREFTTGCCEPDAEEYECEVCGQNTVYGAMQAVLLELY